LLREEQGRFEEAILSHKNALAVDTTHVDSKVKLGALLWQVNGTSYIPVSKSYLAKALESEPTHSEAWYHTGLLHKAEGRKHEAAVSFQAALMCEQSSPLEKFTSITPALLW
jgi:cytochrome c-type biogenesis protein CcmH/NrfG